jgi:hypothetical protein
MSKATGADAACSRSGIFPTPGRWRPGRQHCEDSQAATSAVRTEIRIATGKAAIKILPRGVRSGGGLRRGRRPKQQAGSINQSCATAIGLETEVAHAHEAAGQHMQEETAHELLGLDGEQASPVAAATIAIGKGDAALVEGQQAFVADGDPMGVATEIVQYLGGTGQGRLAIDDPVPGRGLTEQPAARCVCRPEPLGEAVEELCGRASRVRARGPGSSAGWRSSARQPCSDRRRSRCSGCADGRPGFGTRCAARRWCLAWRPDAVRIHRGVSPGPLQTAARSPVGGRPGRSGAKTSAP